MAIPVWPVTLPQSPLREGFQKQPPNLTRRIKANQGPDIVQADAVLGVEVWPSVKFHLTTEQLATLRTFVFDTLRSGARRFTFPDITGTGTVEARIVPASERQLYTVADAGAKDLWRVELTLEVLP